MLCYTCQIREYDNHVYLPMASQMVGKIIHELGIGKIFNDRVEVTSEYRARSKSDRNDGTPVLRENVFECIYAPNLDPRSLPWEMSTPATFSGMGVAERDIRNNKPILYDKYSDLAVHEKCVPCMLMLTCKMKFKDRLDGQMALSRLIAKYTNGEIFVPESFTYDYPLPDDAAMIAYQIATLRRVMIDDRGNINRSRFIEWMMACSCERITFSTNRRLEQNDKRLVVRRNNYNCMAKIELSQEIPTTEASAQSPDIYLIEFTVQFQFNRPEYLYLTYPPVVRNELIPESLVPVEALVNESQRVGTGRFNYDTEHFLEASKQAMFKPQQLTQHPWYDNWIVPGDSIFKQLGYRPFFIGIFLLDQPECPTAVTTINIEECLGGGILKPEVVDRYKLQGPRSLSTDRRFSIEVYSNNFLVEPQTLTLEDGVTLTIPNRDLHRVYRLVLSENKDKDDGPHHAFRVGHYDIVTHR